MTLTEIRISCGGQEIYGVLHSPSPDPRGPCVVLSHGLISSMESPKFRLMADTFAREGIAALRFDFRGCGSSGGDIRDTTVSGRVADLEAVLDHVRKDLGWGGPLGLLGSSMGGYVSLLVFAKREDIGAVCVWATPFDLRGLSELGEDPDMASIGPAFYEDLQRHDLASRGPRIHHLMVLHGQRDEVVPEAHAWRIYAIASEPKELHVLPGADHRFTDPALRIQATELSLRWFQRFLR